MAVISTPHSARIRYQNVLGVGVEREARTVQTLTRVNPGLAASDVTNIAHAINVLRNTTVGQPITSGIYTVMDELEEV